MIATLLLSVGALGAPSAQAGGAAVHAGKYACALNVLDGSGEAIELDLAEGAPAKVHIAPNHLDTNQGDGIERAERAAAGARWFEFAAAEGGKPWIVLKPHAAADSRLEIAMVLESDDEPKGLAIATGMCAPRPEGVS